MMLRSAAAENSPDCGMMVGQPAALTGAALVVLGQQGGICRSPGRSVTSVGSARSHWQSTQQSEFLDELI